VTDELKKFARGVQMVAFNTNYYFGPCIQCAISTKFRLSINTTEEEIKDEFLLQLICQQCGNTIAFPPKAWPFHPLSGDLDPEEKDKSIARRLEKYRTIRNN
jgi:hypothetical protein